VIPNDALVPNGEIELAELSTGVGAIPNDVLAPNGEIELADLSTGAGVIPNDALVPNGDTVPNADTVGAVDWGKVPAPNANEGLLVVEPKAPLPNGVDVAGSVKLLELVEVLVVAVEGVGNDSAGVETVGAGTADDKPNKVELVVVVVGKVRVDVLGVNVNVGT